MAQSFTSGKDKNLLDFSLLFKPPSRIQKRMIVGCVVHTCCQETPQREQTGVEAGAGTQKPQCRVFLKFNTMTEMFLKATLTRRDAQFKGRSRLVGDRQRLVIVFRAHSGPSRRLCPRCVTINQPTSLLCVLLQPDLQNGAPTSRKNKCTN